MARYLSWVKDQFGNIQSLSGDTEAEARAEATRRGWTVISGQYGSWPVKPSATPTITTPTPTKLDKPMFSIPMIYEEKEEPSYIKEHQKKVEEELIALGRGDEVERNRRIFAEEARRAEERRLQQQKDSYNTFQMQQPSGFTAPRTTALSIAPMTTGETEQIQSKLSKITKDYLVETEDINDNVWLSQKTRTAKTQALQDLYTKRAQKELQNLIMYSPETVNKFVPQLEEMAKAGFKMADIQKTIKDITTGVIEPIKPELENWYARYMAPEVLKQYQAPIIPYQQEMFRQIEQLRQIPEQYRGLFYGTPEKQGELQQLKAEAEREKQIINTQFLSQQTTLKTAKDLSISTLKADFASQNADIELRQQRAKDYLTGQLAKLGALNTTGAAVQAITQLDVDYNRMKVDLQTNYNNNITQNEMKYNELLSNLEAKKEEATLNIDRQVNKTQATKDKEILELELKVDDKISDLNMKLLDKNIQAFRDALVETKKQSAEFVKNYFNIVSGGTQQQLLAQVMPKILNFAKEQQALKNLKENLTIRLKEKALAKKTGMGVGMNVEDWIEQVMLKEISLSSVPNKIQAFVSKEIKKRGGIPLTPFEQIEKNLLSEIGKDGFVSPDDYAAAKKDWIQAGGAPSLFDKKFQDRRNPENPYYKITKLPKKIKQSETPAWLLK